MLQRVDLEHHGRPIKGIEIIGHLRPFGQEPSGDIWSRYYDSLGDTLDYVYEVDGETRTIGASLDRRQTVDGAGQR
jgi:hypothetical protein